MQTDEYIATLAKEGVLLVEASRHVGAATPVPTCPEWALRDLLAHVGFVHRWATAYVAKGLTEMVVEPAEAEVLSRATTDDQLVAWVGEGHRALVEALSSAPAALECWTFLPAPSSLAFWARRQAHETTVHRVDAELSAGRAPSLIDATFAVDGTDELLLGFLARPRSRRLPKLVPGVATFEATDTGDSWAVRISPDRMETRKGTSRVDDATDSDLFVRAPVSDLYFLLWNRRRAAGMDVTGREYLLDQWAEQVRVIW
jgi:uncharacterized protein (TIGR03083 family)